MADVSRIMWSGCWVRVVVTGRTNFMVVNESLREGPQAVAVGYGKWHPSVGHSRDKVGKSWEWVRTAG